MRTGFPLTLSLLLTGCHVGGLHTERSFPDDVERVVVLLDSGNIDVSGVPGRPAHVHIDMVGVGDEYSGMSVQDGVLTVDYRCGMACGGDVRVEVPPDVDVEVRLERGDIWIDSMDGEIRGTLGAGDLWTTSLGSRDIALAVGVGDLAVETTGEPLSLWADLGAGDASLTVPAGGYRLVDMDLGLGELWMDGVHEDRSAPGRIHVRAGVGVVWINGE